MQLKTLIQKKTLTKFFILSLFVSFFFFVNMNSCFAKQEFVNKNYKSNIVLEKGEKNIKKRVFNRKVRLNSNFGDRMKMRYKKNQKRLDKLLVKIERISSLSTKIGYDNSNFEKYIAISKEMRIKMDNIFQQLQQEEIDVFELRKEQKELRIEIKKNLISIKKELFKLKTYLQNKRSTK